MNVLVIDPAGDRTAEEVFAHVGRLFQPEHVGLARTEENGCPSILFDSGEGVFPAAAPEGPLPLVMLTCDHFDWDAELVVLTDEWTTWGGHLDRLLDTQQGQQKEELDAFYSFGTECAVAPGGPRLAPLIDISGVALPSLVWFREASRFYSLTQKAIRKDARVGGKFTFGSLVRELYLSHANVAYQCADRRPLRALTRVLDPVLLD